MELGRMIRGLQGWHPAILGALLVVALGSAAHSQSVQQVAAIVNDDVISTYDLDQRIKLVLASSGVQPSSDIIDRVKQQILRTLVDERLKLHEAEKNKVTVSDDDVTKAIDDLAKRNNLPKGAIEQMLDHAGVAMDTLRQQVRADTAWNKLILEKYSSRVFVSDADIDAELKRLMDSFNEEQYEVSEIVLNVNDQKDDEDVRRTAQRLLEQMQKGTPFNAIAQQFSQSPSAAQGGDLGWLLPEDLDPEVAKNVVKMVPGQVTPPIRTSTGYHIIALRSRRKGSDGEPGQLISVTLKQVFIPVSREHTTAEVTAARGKLEAVRTRINGCAHLDSLADGSQIITSDLGKIPFQQIAPFFRSTVMGLEPGQSSAPVEGPAGMHVLVMCDREMTEGVKAKPPTREEVENKLWAEKMAGLERRYLRDLRRDSVVEYR